MFDLGFAYPPSPHILQWLAGGQLANRVQRSLRLWVLVHRFYGLESPWREILPQPFTYPELRALLFAPSHPQSDQLSVDELVAACGDSSCICHQSWWDLVFAPETNQSESQWRPAVMQMTGLSEDELAKKLLERPFATVHRSIRDDLKQLCHLRWLQSHRTGAYRYYPPSQWPTPPAEIAPSVSLAQLSGTQTWELLRVLESIAFVQPELEVVVRSLWEQIGDRTASSGKLAQEPTQRIFIHLDYILSENVQERVDTYQEQLESLWRRHEGGVVQFKYLLVSQEREILVTTYPVCLHYMRRAKYLTAYGVDPQGKFGWHNYRLDRIISNKLKILAWGDPNLPKLLKNLWRSGQLPTAEEVRTKLDEAWGFNFYLPSELLILRFPAKFARWYVDDTVRHPTFGPIAYQELPRLICQQIKDPQQQQQLLQIIAQKPATDAYYQGFIRTGDINVLMRLRDWRPNGEVIAPLSIRLLLQKEAERELSNYQSFSDLKA